MVDVWFLTAFNMKYVAMVTTGAAAEKASKCPWMCFFSRPECMRKETKPKAAGAYKTTKIARDWIHRLWILRDRALRKGLTLCRITARNIITCTVTCPVATAAPRANPSAVSKWKLNQNRGIQDFLTCVTENKSAWSSRRIWFLNHMSTTPVDYQKICWKVLRLTTFQDNSTSSVPAACITRPTLAVTFTPFGPETRHTQLDKQQICL